MTSPTQYFLCSGDSEGFTTLNAFDAALLKAGVGNTNLVRMSSILPPGIVRIEPVPLVPGCFLPIAYSCIQSSTPQVMIAAAVAVAVPKDPSLPGVIMEYSALGTAGDAEKSARSMAREALQIRGWVVGEILSATVEHQVETIGAAFAGVALIGEAQHG
ncbi:MAG: arginine decarboxylase, pyruvoyl-dependent [Deltaproteobacteria bacterium]|nr:arginine decarboxylase, pyruvoyl-dependent [Deltaproteobacteria bacterium]